MQRGLLQIEREILGGLVTPFSALLQTAPDNPVHLQRDLRGQIGGVVVEDRGSRLDRRLPLEGALSGEHFIQDSSRAEDVRAVVRLAAADLLRGHVLDGSENWPQVGARRRRLRLRRWHKPGSRQLGEAEIEDLQPSLVRDEEVLRLHVAVDHAVLVRCRQTFRQVDGVTERRFQRQRLAVEALAQRRAVQQLRDDVRARSARPDVVHSENVRVVERTCRSRFLREPTQLLFGVRTAREELDRDLPVELQISRNEDATHSSASELPLDPIPLAELDEVRRSGSTALGPRGRALVWNGRNHEATCSR